MPTSAEFITASVIASLQAACKKEDFQKYVRDFMEIKLKEYYGSEYVLEEGTLHDVLTGALYDALVYTLIPNMSVGLYFQLQQLSDTAGTPPSPTHI